MKSRNDLYLTCLTLTSCPRPQIVIRLLYVLKLFFLCFSALQECFGYSILSDAWRNSSNGAAKFFHCDQNLPDVWYRFAPPAGVRMATSCIAPYHCGTHAPVWMKGNHPTASEGIVSRDVCGSWTRGCCQIKHTVKVRLCLGSFYIYKFGRLPHCTLAFCGTGKRLGL